jgi:hypothetical protein
MYFLQGTNFFRETHVFDSDKWDLAALFPEHLLLEAGFRTSSSVRNRIFYNVQTTIGLQDKVSRSLACFSKRLLKHVGLAVSQQYALHSSDD